MDLDAFSKGKAKCAKNAWEKGKGKGKGKELATRVVPPDHMQNQCPKGKGKGGKGKGKGKDGKGKAP
eukprot:4937591-Amphidinium_carterae.1